jgi:hypothetical protein
LLSGRRRAGSGTVIASVTSSATTATILLVALCGGRPGRRCRRLSLLCGRGRRRLSLRGGSTGVAAAFFAPTPSAILFRRFRGRRRFCRRLSLLLGRRAVGATATVTTPFAALAGRSFIGSGFRVRGLCNLDAFVGLDLLRRQAAKCDGIERGE